MTIKFRKMCEIYRIFSRNWDCDISNKAMQEMFEFETYGRGSIEISGFNTTGKRANGYAVGKKWLNVMVSEWIDEMEKYGWIDVIERLYSDPLFPKWWLNDIFREYITNKCVFYHDHGILFADEYFKLYLYTNCLKEK